MCPSLSLGFVEMGNLAEMEPQPRTCLFFPYFAFSPYVLMDGPRGPWSQGYAALRMELTRL